MRVLNDLSPTAETVGPMEFEYGTPSSERAGSELLKQLRDLEAERAQLAAIVEGSRDAIWSWNPDGIITRWNAEAERLFGYSKTEIIGQSLLQLVPPDRRDRARQVMQQIENGAWYGQYQTQRLHKDGTIVEVELTVSPMKDGRGTRHWGIDSLPRHHGSVKTRRHLSPNALLNSQRFIDLPNVCNRRLHRRISTKQPLRRYPRH